MGAGREIMSKEKNQLSLFEQKEWWEDDWEGMPEFVQDDLNAYKSIIVNFEKEEDFREFSKLIKQKMRLTTKSIWYPQMTLESILNKRYKSES